MGFLQEQDIEQLVGDIELSKMFGKMEEILIEPALVKIAANFILNDIVGQKKKDIAWQLPDPIFIAEIVRKYHEGVIASPQAKQAILSGKMVASIDDAELSLIVQKIIEAHTSVVAEYKAGKEASLQYLIGQGMKETKGSANPTTLKKLFIAIINK